MCEELLSRLPALACERDWMYHTGMTADSLCFSALFHRSSKDRAKGHAPVPEDPALWPREWKTVYYKAYPGLSSVDLGTTPRPGAADIFNVLSRRASRKKCTGESISAEEISALLRYSCGLRSPGVADSYARMQPSAGARFPIEVYPIVLRDDKNMPAGVYHYAVREHRLDVLWKRAFTVEDAGQLFPSSASDAAVVFVLTAVFWRTRHKYGERGYRYVLLEAGHIGQNLYLVSEALGLRCCAIGSTKDEALEKLIGIDGVTESVVYALAVGK